MLVVSVLILNEMKATFIKFSRRMNEQEFMNLAKFLVISGVILPVLPNEQIVEGIALTPYNIWLTTVVISGFSYISYLLKRYVFNQSGIIVSGLLGGIYSSMATTVILTKKAATVKENELGQYTTAVFCSVSTLYVKYMILMAIFNMRLLTNYWFLFAAMFVCGLAVAGYLYFRDQKKAKAAMASKTDEAELQEEVRMDQVQHRLYRPVRWASQSHSHRPLLHPEVWEEDPGARLLLVGDGQRRQARAGDPRHGPG